MARNWSLAVGILLTFFAGAQAQPALQTEYYPLQVGHKWTYLATDLKSPLAKTDPKHKVVVQVERPEMFVDKKTDEKMKVIETKYTGFLLKSTSRDKVTRDHVVVVPDGIYRVHLAGTPFNPPLLFFKFGLKAGGTWPAESVSGNTTLKGVFALKSEDVEVRKVVHKDAWLVSYRGQKVGEDQVEIDSWYVKGTGMVKQRVRAKNHEVLLELEKFEKAK